MSLHQNETPNVREARLLAEQLAAGLIGRTRFLDPACFLVTLYGEDAEAYTMRVEVSNVTDDRFGEVP